MVRASNECLPLTSAPRETRTLKKKKKWHEERSRFCLDREAPAEPPRGRARTGLNEKGRVQKPGHFRGSSTFCVGNYNRPHKIGPPIFKCAKTSQITCFKKKKKICALSYKRLKDELLQSHTETVFKPLTQANYPVSSTNIKERKL